MNNETPEPQHKTDHAVRSMFNRIAHRYDLANHLLSMGQDLRWRKYLARLTQNQHPSIVVDVCTGSGDSARFYPSSPKLVVGLDFSRPMLLVASRKNRKNPAPYPLAWVEADALRLPFRSNCADLVTIEFGLRNLKDYNSGIQEFQRILKPGGQLLILEFTLPRSRLWKAIYSFYLGKILPWLGGWITGNREAYRYLNDTIRMFPHYDDLVSEVTKCTFRLLRMKTFFYGVATAYLFERMDK